MSDPTHFPYRFDNRWKPLFTVLGVKSTDGVDLQDGMFRASYGRARIETPITNIDHTEVTGPHRWYTAVGMRLSFADDGLTFGTNYELGLCIEFIERIPRVLGFKDHSALWVSVAHPQALADAIGR